MSDQTTPGDLSADNRRLMLVAYRHDAHKLLGEPHSVASETIADTRINQKVPLHADRDAAALSRPSRKPEFTVDGYRRPYRLSLLHPQSRSEATDQGRQTDRSAIERLLTHDDTARMHRAWLTSTVAGRYNESVYYPYTSLKYHTLLVAALLDNYRTGYEFADLHLIVDAPHEIIPHRTIYAGDRFTLHLDANPNGRPTARLGSRPWRSWAAVWSRLSDHPLDTDDRRRDMVLDANLRRIGAWSTALQYLEAFENTFVEKGSGR